MEKFLNIKKGKFVIFSLLFFNQFLFEGNAFNYKKIDIDKSEDSNLERKFYESSNILLTEENGNQINTIEKEKREINAFSKEVEDFLEHTLEPNNFKDFKNKKNKLSPKKDNFFEMEKESINKDSQENNSTN